MPGKLATDHGDGDGDGGGRVGSPTVPNGADAAAHRSAFGAT